VPARTPSTAPEPTRPVVGSFARGIPLLALVGDAEGDVAASGGRPRRCPERIPQWRGCRHPFLPLRRLDRVVTSRARAPASHQLLTWGFPLFPCSTAERGEAGEKEGRAAARDALRGRKPSCRGSEHHTEPRDRSRGDAAARNTYNTDVNSYPEPATTTPPTRREHPTAISFPSSLDAS
jgi:hypothetical protein